MDKLQKLQKIIEVLDNDTVTQDEFVEMFGVLIDFVGQIKEENEKDRDEIEKIAYKAMDSCMVKMEKKYASEWVKIKDKVNSLKDGRDGLQGSQGVQGIQGPKGDKGDKGDKGEDGLDLFPNTPNEEVDKINQATNQIDAERVKGLVELSKRPNQIALPPTTNHFYKNGTHIGRAKNINFESTGSADVNIKGDIATVKLTYITVSDTPPTNPQLNDLWIQT